MDYFDVLFAKTNGISSSSCYNEIEAMLKTTVGHSSKNLLDITKYTANTNVSNMQINETTGSLSFTGTGAFKDVRYNNDLLGLEPNNNATYVVSCINNLVTETDGRLTVRSRRDNTVKYTVNFKTTGEKKLIFTVDSETFPDGWFISIMATGSTSTTGSIDISNLMLREASISDDTFEPYVTPTDEKKQDKIKMIYVAPTLESASDEVTIPRTNDIDLFVAICLAIGDTNTTVSFIVPQELFGYPCVNGDFSITGRVVDETHNKLTFGFPNTFSAGKIIRVLGIPNISYEAGE